MIGEEIGKGEFIMNPFGISVKSVIYSNELECKRKREKNVLSEVQCPLDFLSCLD